MNPVPALRHRTKKGKIIVMEGTIGITFNYSINPQQLRCQCSSGKYRPGEPVCHHLEYYLCDVMGIKKHYLPVLSVPRVRSKINEIWRLGGDSLNQYCLRFLTNDEEDQCVICHESYSNIHQVQDSRNALYQCPKCFELSHHSCHKKWIHTGGGCPRCNYMRDINGGFNNDTDIQSLFP